MNIQRAVAKQNSESQARMAILKARILAAGKSVRVDGGSYGVAYNRAGVAVLCFIPD